MIEVIDYNKKIDVLACEEGDPGFVRLADHMGSDLSIVRNARVSFNADWRDEIEEGETLPKDVKLINYLINNKHTSPLESVQFIFEIKAPIFIFRQWHRHRMWSYNEISGRYTELDEGFYVPPIESIGEQSKNNKQARVINVDLTEPDFDDRTWDIARVNDLSRNAFALYKDLIERKWPRELARTVLPVSTYSRMFARTDLHNLMHFITLRLHPHAQYEIKVYAEALLELITPVVPVAIEAYLKNKKFTEDVLNNKQFITDALVHKTAVEEFLRNFCVTNV